MQYLKYTDCIIVPVFTHSEDFQSLKNDKRRKIIAQQLIQDAHFHMYIRNFIASLCLATLTHITHITNNTHENGESYA